ncbi:MAG TPA: Bax inhibitor-1 family protein [Actinomycetota bacterium]
MENRYGVAPVPVAALGTDQRVMFIRRTYGHLLAAIAGFVAIETVAFSLGIAQKVSTTVLGAGGAGWLLVLGGFILVGTLASRAAARAVTLGAQRAALAGYVAAEALIFMPMLYLAELQTGGGVIASAALVTMVGFLALTGIAVTSKRDFSVLRGVLMWVGVAALLAIVGSVIFGAVLGTWFSVAMIAFAGAAILFSTSRVMRHYPEDRYVSAALELFASVALMFWYVLRLFMSRR